MKNSVKEQISGLFTKKAAEENTSLSVVISITGAGEYLITDKGVTLAKRTKEGEEPIRVRITEERLKVTAIGRTQEKTDYSLLLEWDDLDGNAHSEIISKADLESEGKDVRRLLASGGLTIRSRSGVSDYLLDYLRSCFPKDRFISVNRLGWQKNSRNQYYYVFSDGPEGEIEERVIYRPEDDEKSLPNLETSGTWEEWRDNVAPLCTYSSRGCTAVCAAFAAPLLRLLDIETFGLHFVGKTSRGKSTIGQLAASVFGVYESYKKTWSSTTTGIEGQAYNFNDLLLILDEINQVNPVDLAGMIYAVGNEIDKSRGNKTGGVRISKRWRVLVLSTGEETIRTIIKKCGRSPTAGLDVRLAPIRAQATDNEDLGVNESFPKGMDAIKYKDYLVTMVKKYHGAIFRAWIKYIAGLDPVKLKEDFREYREKFSAKYRPTAQNRRIAQNFAVVAFAGELATKAGFTGWPDIPLNTPENNGSESVSWAFAAVGKCFSSTLEMLGNALPIEDKRALEHIEEILTKERSCFCSVLNPGLYKPNPNYGFFDPITTDPTTTDETLKRIYYVEVPVFRDHFCLDMGEKETAKILKKWGVLETEGGRAKKRCNIPNEPRGKQFYVIHEYSTAEIEEGILRGSEE